MTFVGYKNLMAAKKPQPVVKVPDCKTLSFQVPGTEIKLPMIGFGCSRCKTKEELEVSIQAAIAAGYRLFDTSASYEHEKELGRILKEMMLKYNLERNDVFITSKLAQRDIGKNADKALQKSLKNLKLKYLDIYLIEWPMPSNKDPVSPENAAVRSECWKALVKAKNKGLVHHLGVSNFDADHLSGLLENCYDVRPVINQIEWHLFWHPKDVKQLCERETILLQAYLVLGGARKQELLNNQKVVNIANKLRVSSARLLLRWALQSGVAIIPSSNDVVHIKDNINLNFHIPSEDMAILNDFKQTAWTMYPSSIK